MLYCEVLVKIIVIWIGDNTQCLNKYVDIYSCTKYINIKYIIELRVKLKYNYIWCSWLEVSKESEYTLCFIFWVFYVLIYIQWCASLYTNTNSHSLTRLLVLWMNNNSLRAIKFWMELIRGHRGHGPPEQVLCPPGQTFASLCTQKVGAISQ